MELGNLLDDFQYRPYIIFPLLACLVFAPNFIEFIRETDTKTIVAVFLLGAVYGVGNLSFGLALR